MPMEVVPRSSDSWLFFGCRFRNRTPGPPPFSFHAAAWLTIGSILSSFLPISRLAISTS